VARRWLLRVALLMLVLPLALAAQAPIGGVQEDIKLLKRFDENNDGWLNRKERMPAREAAKAAARQNGGGVRGGFPPAGFPDGAGGRGPMGRGRMGPAGPLAPAAPGPRLEPSDISKVTTAPVYDMSTLRTLFLVFENPDWEQELTDFHGTDVDVPATLIIDRKEYKDVGVRFRGLSSYMGVPEGYKRSLNISVDMAHPGQNVMGVRTLNLLNSHEDPTFLRSVLYSTIARAYIPAPKANYMRVSINNESWGIYVNAEQYNKDFIKEWFGTTGGARWKVPGSPMGRGGLEYIGDDAAAYKKIFDLKTKDDPNVWAALITLCKTLNTTPPQNLAAAINGMLDVDGTLRFLALEMALVNGDGYWTRTSDYALYLDEKGTFHVIPHDMNEAFAASGFGRGGAPGGRRGEPPPDFLPPGVTPPVGRGMPVGPAGFGFMMGGGPDLDPLIGVDDPGKPLRSKLLAVPEFRAKYLAYVRDIATTWLDWKTLGPIATEAQALIAAEVAKDTRKLDGLEPASGSLRAFVEDRRKFLLKK